MMKFEPGSSTMQTSSPSYLSHHLFSQQATFSTVIPSTTSINNNNQGPYGNLGLLLAAALDSKYHQYPQIAENLPNNTFLQSSKSPIDQNGVFLSRSPLNQQNLSIQPILAQNFAQAQLLQHVQNGGGNSDHLLYPFANLTSLLHFPIGHNNQSISIDKQTTSPDSTQSPIVGGAEKSEIKIKSINNAMKRSPNNNEQKSEAANNVVQQPKRSKKGGNRKNNQNKEKMNANKQYLRYKILERQSRLSAVRQEQHVIKGQQSVITLPLNTVVVTEKSNTSSSSTSVTSSPMKTDFKNAKNCQILMPDNHQSPSPDEPILNPPFFGGSPTNVANCLRALEQYVSPAPMDHEPSSPVLVVDAIENCEQRADQQSMPADTTPDVAASTSPSTLSTRSPVPSEMMERDDLDEGKLVVAENPDAQLVAQRFFDACLRPSTPISDSFSCNGDEAGCSSYASATECDLSLEPMLRNRSFSCFVNGTASRNVSAFSPVIRGIHRPVIRQPSALVPLDIPLMNHNNAHYEMEQQHQHGQTRDIDASNFDQAFRNGELMPGDVDRYFERRRRNNEAAKRCRANRRALFEVRFQRARELEMENLELREAVKRLNQEVGHLKNQLGAKRHRSAQDTPPQIASTSASHSAAALSSQPKRSESDDDANNLQPPSLIRQVAAPASFATSSRLVESPLDFSQKNISRNG